MLTVFVRVILLFLVMSGAAFPDDESEQLLTRVRAKIAEELKTIPRFVCRQRIERRVLAMKSQAPRSCAALMQARSQQSPEDWRVSSYDRANLDVMLTEGREMFSWPGAHTFEANSPGDLLVRGMSGAGDYGGFIADIFSGKPGIVFKYGGVCGGASCVRFKYDVPREISRYVLRTPNDSAITEYDGYFDIDPRTADLLELQVHPIDLHHLNLCGFLTTVSYSRASTSSGSFVIPKSTERDAYYAEGSVYETKTSYEGCRQYTAESVLKATSDEPSATRDAVPVRSSPPIQSGTTLELRLLTTIDSESSAAGDPVEAVVAKEARSPFGTVVARANTVVRGHILQLEHYSTPAVVVRLQFDAVVLDGVEVPITLEPSPQKHLANTGNFVFQGKKVSLGKSFVSEWVVRPAAR